jgi:hypothetical protein
MNNLNRLALSTGTAAALALLSFEASAVINIAVPSAGGLTYVGMISGNAYVAFDPNTGAACQWWNVEAPGATQGLADDVQINGTTGADGMYAYSTNFTRCGNNWTPIVLNGRQLGFNGGDGGDFLAWRATWMIGGGGDDFIWGTDGITTAQWGSAGNDRIFAGAVASVAAEGGNDGVCMWGSSVAFSLNGGTGTDTFCGTAPGLFSGFESINPGTCPVCLW